MPEPRYPMELSVCIDEGGDYWAVILFGPCDSEADAERAVEAAAETMKPHSVMIQ